MNLISLVDLPSTMINFCWGDVLAKTISAWFFNNSSNCSVLISFRSVPWITHARASRGLTCPTDTPTRWAMSSTVSEFSEIIPTARAMALAVIGWSPVTMITLIPAERHLATLNQTERSSLRGEREFNERFRNSSTRRINHRHQAEKPKIIQRKIRILSVELEIPVDTHWPEDENHKSQEHVLQDFPDPHRQSERQFLQSKQKLSIDFPSLSFFPDLTIVHFNVLSIDEDRRTQGENSLRCSFHHQKIVHTLLLRVSTTRMTNFMNGHLKFVRRIERNLAHFPIGFAEFDHIANLNKHLVDQTITVRFTDRHVRRVRHIWEALIPKHRRCIRVEGHAFADSPGLVWNPLDCTTWRNETRLTSPLNSCHRYYLQRDRIRILTDCFVRGEPT